MLTTDTTVYLQFPDNSGKRVLHPGKVQAVNNNVYTAEFEDETLSFEAGQDVIIYYNKDRKFVQQTARIDAVMQTDPQPVVGFQFTSDAISAESRQSYRVSTVVANITATVGGETYCPLLDVSATGFAVTATTSYNVGQVLDVTLAYEGTQFAGPARVQSIRELDNGKIRYGFHSLEDKKCGGTLRKGLQTVSISVQREQARRLKRSG